MELSAPFSSLASRVPSASRGPMLYHPPPSHGQARHCCCYAGTCAVGCCRNAPEGRKHVFCFPSREETFCLVSRRENQSCQVCFSTYYQSCLIELIVSVFLRERGWLGSGSYSSFAINLNALSPSNPRPTHAHAETRHHQSLGQLHVARNLGVEISPARCMPFVFLSGAAKLSGVANHEDGSGATTTGPPPPPPPQPRRGMIRPVVAGGPPPVLPAPPACAPAAASASAPNAPPQGNICAPPANNNNIPTVSTASANSNNNNVLHPTGREPKAEDVLSKLEQFDPELHQKFKAIYDCYVQKIAESDAKLEREIQKVAAEIRREFQKLAAEIRSKNEKIAALEAALKNSKPIETVDLTSGADGNDFSGANNSTGSPSKKPRRDREEDRPKSILQSFVQVKEEKQAAETALGGVRED
ncbi:hypothetical protein ACHAW5_007498 [Stephanodiscus triporus]|uniref:Inhibitor of growth protein N-terminal histone-binding domain-containing protein n=1 Tax=Stephanodiscus triporus TaxID=2934178 RepID=A0ABD3P629_9STRA